MMEVGAIMPKKADLLLHPVRMRILQQVMLEKRLTAQELVERLPEVPPATLYRHLSRMVAGSVLEVVEQRQVRGAVERVYAVQMDKAVVTAEDLAKMSPEEHMKYFTMYMSNLLGAFHRYLQGDVNMVRDGLTYRFVELYQTDEEYQQMLAELRAAIIKHMENPPGPGRRARTVATMVIPEPTRPKQKE